MSKYSEEFKESVVRKMMPSESKGIAELSRETGVSEVTLYKWGMKKVVKILAKTQEIKEKVMKYFETLRDAVTYYGVVTGKKKKELLIKNYIFCLLTKNMEGQPISILEAMANGCVIFTTNQGGIPDVVEDGVNGKRIMYISSSEIADVLKHWSEMRANVFVENWRKVISRYTIQHFISRLSRVLGGISSL